MQLISHRPPGLLWFHRQNAEPAVDRSELISLIPTVVEAMNFFAEQISRVSGVYQSNFLQELQDEFAPTAEASADSHRDFIEDYDEISDSFLYDRELTSNIREKYFTEERVLGNFLPFLNEICMEVVHTFKSCFSPEIVVRAHFRWHNFTRSGKKVTADSYQMLCQYSNLPDESQQSNMQEVPWDGLIKCAFDTGEPIVYSANKRYNPINTSWGDFVTMIPKFSDNSHDVRISKMPTSRPVITFGLSVMEAFSKQDIFILYLLTYLRFDELLAHVIDEYIRIFCIDVKKLLPKIKEIKNKN